MTLDKQQLNFALILLGLLVLALLYNLGLQPLYQEEPRRAMIALEMVFRGDWIVPTQFGEYYRPKPPLWNWMIILGFKLFGTYGEWPVRIFTVLSFLGIGGLMYQVGRRYVSQAFGVLSALFFLVSVDLLFYFSMLGEIDVFYSLLTFGSFMAVFHFYQQKQYYALFLSSYLLASLGFLTKAFPSVVFIGMTLLVWLIYNKDVKRLFTLPHILGGGLFLVVVGTYFWVYDQRHDAALYLEILWSRSSERTVAGEGRLANLLTHMGFFPFETIGNLLPAALLGIFAFRRGIGKVIRAHPLIAFSLWVFLFNFLVYWIAPEAKQRYIYMLYPLAIFVLTYLYHEFGQTDHRKRVALDIIIGVIVCVLPLAALAVPFVPQLSMVEHRWLVALVVGGGGLTAVYLYVKRPKLRVMLLFLTLILGRLGFDHVVLPIRDQQGLGAENRQQAYEILKLAEGRPVFLYKESFCARTTTYYLERETEAVLSRKTDIDPAALYIVAPHHIERLPMPHRVVYSFYSWGPHVPVYLVEFEP